MGPGPGDWGQRGGYEGRGLDNPNTLKYFYVNSSWSRSHGDFKISVKLTIRNTVRQQRSLFA